MTWICNLSHKAEKQLQNLPRNIQKRIAKAIDDLEKNPLAGDVKPLKGKIHRGRYRKRVGQYRIIFTTDKQLCVVGILAILPRGETTY